MQIIVLGAHRSGTSMVTRLVNMMGAYFGMGETSIGANNENPKGFWERADVIDANNKILEYYGCTWDQVAEWNFKDDIPKKDASVLTEVTDSMKKILLELDASRPWVMKDPRLCLTYPHWKPLLEVPVVICVYRNPQEIARSLKTRNNISFAHSMALWEYYATGIANSLRGSSVAFVSHASMLSDPVGTVQQLFEDLKTLGVRGLDMPSEQEITAFVDPELYRSQGSEEEIGVMVTDYQKDLMDYVSGRASVPDALLHPTELAKDLVMSLSQQLDLQEQMEDLRHRHSEALQHQKELESKLDNINGVSEEVLHGYQAQVDEARANLRFVKESTSWRVGHKLVRFFRAITFQGNKT